MDAQLLKLRRELRPDLTGLCKNERLIELSEPVRFDGHCFRIDGKTASGVLTRLERVTGWSNADPYKRTYAMMKHRRDGVINTRRSCPTWGVRHGTRVHSEIAKSCRFIANLRSIGKKIRKRDPCTERILNFLGMKGWIPVASELPVGMDGLATAVDLVTVDRVTGDLIAIEIKTGYESETYGPTDGDNYLGIGGLRDCPRDRHELQLAATCLLMPIRPDRAYIIRPQSKARGLQWNEVRWWKTPSNTRNLMNLLFNNNNLRRCR